ncbi:MAG: DNA mismatch repair endonuclease MutL, partial [Candidatus Tectomicrobia bacterium]|nr:DNA mismatch repair endonuclease MutL [Candidatus Tectomicrobia bacterium]
MGTRIRILPDDLANKIAAGEVVERPASVVKELVENSIDAEAHHITIEIRSGGKQFIRVIDDGSGMDRDDALLAFERHATSKIRTPDDLGQIRTLGFRGEALPSIAAVSRVTLITATRENRVGTKVLIDGGIVGDVADTGAPPGTSVEVRQLFFNIPARRKFLKSDGTELSHITSAITCQALAHPHIHFRLIHDGKSLINAVPTHDILERLASLFGLDFARTLLKVESESSYGIIKGFVSKPSATRATRSHHYFFVNRRHIRNGTINHALYDAYHTLLPVNRHPAAFLFLEVSPRVIDVNVHPSKIEVRFDNQNELFNLVKEGIRRHLVTPSEALLQEVLPRHKAEGLSTRSESLPQRERTIEALGRFLSHQEEKSYDAQRFENPKIMTPKREVSSLKSTAMKGDHALLKFPSLSELRPLGQIHRSFIVVESRNGLVLIDQHAAHERILYTRLIESVEKASLDVQNLLFPQSLHLSQGEAILLKEHLDQLKMLGFEIEEFGQQTFLIRSIPALLAERDYGLLLRDILDKIQSYGTVPALHDMIDDFLTLMACHSAIRANQSLEKEEIERLIRDLEQTEISFKCPHGRPAIVELTLEEIEREFL